MRTVHHLGSRAGNGERGTVDGVPLPGGGTLGTFAGVFTPSVLTILGIILFLRLGFVVGAAGLGRALVIILMANAISVLTSLSLSAIATNLRVRGGGDYYLISRTLGVEFGGALGLVLFLAQSVSIAFYSIGFGEAVAAMAGLEMPWADQAIAAVAVAALFVLSWLGADWATRFQYLVMAILASALVAFYVGGVGAFDTAQLRANLAPASDLPFWTIFAIFFPAVTGFTQGVSMSGDLKDPGKSLPRGTFAAVGLSALVYITVALLFGGALPGARLVSDYGAMGHISAVPLLVGAGVIAATLSSALASFLGAPRILQSLAADRVFSLLVPFAKGSGPSNNPRRGVLLSAAIAFATVALGNLNVVAPVVSMFFLISYGLLNYATFVEARSNSPSFRPRFRLFDARLSFLGGVACLGAMLAIDATAGGIAVAALFAVHHYIGRRSRPERWADSGRSRRVQRVREDLHAISFDMEHPRDWRPVILAASDEPGRRRRVLRFATWLEGGSGFTTLVRLLQGEGLEGRRLRDEAEAELWTEIEASESQAFARAVVAARPEEAVPLVLQAHGLGKVKANTILLAWKENGGETSIPFEQRRYGRYLRQALRFGCNAILLSAGDTDFAALEKIRPRDRRIDVWYRDNATGRLMLMLAYLMTRSEGWPDACLRLLVTLPRDGDPEAVRQEMARMLDDVRISADLVVLEKPDRSTLIEQSSGSSVVLLPFRLHGEAPQSVFEGCSLEDLATDLGICAFVLATQEIDLDAQPEEGPEGERAEAEDLARQAERNARRAEKEAVRASEQAEKLGAKLEKARSKSTPAEEMAALEKQASEAVEEATQLRRRAAKARAKADGATQEALDISGVPSGKGAVNPPEDRKP